MQLAQGVEAAALEALGGATAQQAALATGDAPPSGEPTMAPPAPPMSVGIPLKRSAASELALTLGDLTTA